MWEWKPKVTSSNFGKGSGTAGAYDVPTSSVEASAYSQPVSRVIDSEEATSKLQKKCLRKRLIILPLFCNLNHLRIGSGQATKLNNPDLYHYAVFSDNVLACAVIINSTISSAKEPEKIVFNVVTNYLNLSAISMWFLLNPPGKATIHFQSVESFDWLSTKYNSTLKEQKSYDPRFTSALNHLRFYLPDIFPALNKIVLFNHDVVVQRDLTEIWSVDMKGKVNAAVETCTESEASFRTMHMLLNFSDPFLAKRFNPKIA
ncbi:probable galacturonosyltransferase 5 [Hibiscus syriacus]|uniref:probable galacturonosyltransferase 5 n=1 Tax=Hibiscus syriacus TaxID=106335 RepID=UPI0019243001|nr:probable galacturonosyltransferase 5 [Hibiscus syriacus]